MESKKKPLMHLPDQDSVEPGRQEAITYLMAAEPTVFIVDDDQAVREALGLLLKSVGLNAEVYASAPAFLSAYDPNRKGCLLLDVRMPGMSGLELQARLAERRIDIPIILITGHADVPMAIRAFKAGALDLIEKPFDNEAIVKRIKETLALETSERKAAARPEAYFQEGELAHLTLASISDGIITISSSGRIEYLNPVAEHLIGWRNDEARGMFLAEVFKLLDENTQVPVNNLLERWLTEDQNSADEKGQSALVCRDGQELVIEKSLVPIRDRAGHTHGAVIIFRDATQARALSHQLFYHATHDFLTGLVNRREFERRLERALANAREANTEHALCYMDLDGFKGINDIAGHSAGDQLLRELSTLLQKKMRNRDTLARLGGDEFVVLLEHCPLGQAQRIADSLRQAVQDFRLTWEGRTFSVGISIGVTAIAGNGLSEILQAADAACYAAKRQGRNCVHVYQRNATEGSERNGQEDWATYVGHALRENRLRLYRQSIVALDQGDTGEHYEILLRLEEPAGRLTSAARFLYAVERATLGSPVDRWVIDRTLAWLVKQPKRIMQLHTCAIKLSRHSLEDTELPNFLREQLNQSGIPPARFCFEFSETSVTADLERAKWLLEVLKALGCDIAIDNFASTPSGFSYLKQLPVDLVKIDGTLIKNMVDHSVDYAIVKSINEIAHAMGIQTVAKSVENAIMVDTLRTMGVDYLQGNYIAQPTRLEG